jgi:hypothetical protein
MLAIAGLSYALFAACSNVNDGELGRLAMRTSCAASRCRITIGNWLAMKLAANADTVLASSRWDAILLDNPANARKLSANFAVIVALATAIAGIGGDAAQHAALADTIVAVNARVVAVGIPGASALAQIGTFLNVAPPNACANPIPMKFPQYIKAGAVLDPKRLLVGSRSNFGAPPAIGAGQEGAFLSIDPSGPRVLGVPPEFAQSGDQASALGGAVQMFSANSPHWYNGVNNAGANTALYTGVSNPLGLSNNNAFGRIWPRMPRLVSTGWAHPRSSIRPGCHWQGRPTQQSAASMLAVRQTAISSPCRRNRR